VETFLNGGIAKWWHWALPIGGVANCWHCQLLALQIAGIANCWCCQLLALPIAGIANCWCCQLLVLLIDIVAADVSISFLLLPLMWAFLCCCCLYLSNKFLHNYFIFLLNDFVFSKYTVTFSY